MVDMAASSFPLGVVLSLLALPFAAVAGWTLRRQAWRVFTPAIVIVLATAGFVLSFFTWLLQLIALMLGFLVSSAFRGRSAPQHAVD